MSPLARGAAASASPRLACEAQLDGRSWPSAATPPLSRDCSEQSLAESAASPAYGHVTPARRSVRLAQRAERRRSVE